MKLQNCTLDEFAKRCKARKLILFGASEMPKEMCEEYPEYHFETYIEYFVDNSVEKQGKKYELNGRSFDILPPQCLAEHMDSRMLVITSKYYPDIYEQLQGIPELDDKECYIWCLMAPQYKSDGELAAKIRQLSGSGQAIPKKIHYFWFGNNPIPELEQRCIDSWKQIMSDYEIILWNENNYDISKHPYMKQAYEAKKWGFVPDYARLDIIYQYGGICLDTDVEAVRRFDDLLGLNAFAGFESKKLVALGLGFGAVRGSHMIQLLRDDYDRYQFTSGDGIYNETASPFIQTRLLQEYGLENSNQIQQVGDMVILPAECFSPDNNLIPHITGNTYSIHHFSGSWVTGENKELLARLRNFKRKADMMTN